MRIIPFFILILLFLSPLQAFGEVNQKEIDLTTSPGKVLFDLSNIKPGDSVTREFNIANKGTKSFHYITTNTFFSGSELLYRQLDITIAVKNKILYQGKLADLKKLDPRQLNSEQNEKLLIFIKVPNELGNEFQGLSVDFQLKLFVEGTFGGILPASGSLLPETGTTMFNLLVVGTVIILSGLSLQLHSYLKRKKYESMTG